MTPSRSLYRYSIPFKETVRLRSQMHTARTGIIVRTVDRDGVTGLGEAAPLPGFSTETLDDVVAWLRRWCDRPEDVDVTTAPPSARFALTQVQLEQETVRSSRLIHRLLSDTASNVVHANAVVLPTEDLDDQVERIHSGGFSAVKLKVGGDPGLDASRVQDLAARLNGDVAIRLDANRAWSVQDARQFAREIDVERIDYIEEPLTDAAGLEQLVGETGLRVALDETMLEWMEDDLGGATFAEAFVLKPMLIGGENDVRRLLAVAQSADARVVFSGSFESGLGRRLLYSMAAAWAPHEAHGVDTARFLKRDVLTDLIIPSASRYDLVRVLGMPPVLDETILEPVHSSDP